MTKMVMTREDNSKAPNVVGQSSSVLEFVCFLGRGSFGSVALIRDSKQRLHAEKSSPIAYMESLKKEHRIMLRFRNHPRIVQTTNPNLHKGSFLLSKRKFHTRNCGFIAMDWALSGFRILVCMKERRSVYKGGKEGGETKSLRRYWLIEMKVLIV